MKKFLLIFIAILLTSSNGFSQNFWEKTNAPDTAVTNSIAVNSYGNIFIATDAGIFRSTDDGNNWLSLGINKGIRSIYITPGGTIYITSKNQGSILCSTDNGSGWVPIGLTSWQSAVAVNLNGDIFAGTDNYGIYRTTNNGGNWTQIISGLTDTHINCLLIKSNQHVLTGTMFQGVFRSSDNGDNWEQINQGLTSFHITSLASGDEYLFAGTSGSGVFRSSDSGETWTAVNNGITGENQWVRSILISDAGAIFTGTADGVLLSVNNGENWIKINEGLINHNVQGLDNSGGEIYAGTAGGVFRHVGDPTSVTSFNNVNFPTFELFQNYPNPFNPSTKIRYSIPIECRVIIKVYNILGSEVLELINEQKEPGIYETEFNADKLSGGIYFYKMSAANSVQTRKMILLQ